MYLYDNIQVRAVLFYAYTINYLGRLKAFHKERYTWYFARVKGLVKINRFVNSSVFLLVGVQSLWHLPYISFHFHTYPVILLCPVLYFVQHFNYSALCCLQNIIVTTKILCQHLPKGLFVHLSHVNVLRSYDALAKHLSYV